MTRRPAAEIAVRCGATGEPLQFVRGRRLYVVRAILAHWREATRWWATGAGAEDGVRQYGSSQGGASQGGAGQGGVNRVRRDQLAADSIIGSGFDIAPRAIDREVWRVEASIGRNGAAGVFDLARVCQPAAIDELSSLQEPSPLEEHWVLVRVLD